MPAPVCYCRKNRAAQQRQPNSDRQHFWNAPKHNANAGASRLQSAQQLDVLGFAVVKNGQLVASSAARERQNVYSVTKTFVATLIGIMIQNGDLTVSTTLEAALPNVNWAQVSSANEKRAITIGQMLSMSSGLTANCYSYGPQGTVEQTLSSPQFSAAQVGRHNYLCSGSILSYVIYQLTGRTPLQYANEHLFPALGISRSITWSPTYGANGIHEAGHGLVLDPIELAKLGSLYRQGGVTGGNSSTQLIPASFATASNVDQLTQRISSWSLFYLGQRCVFKSSGAGYGYMKWLFSTASGQADCALGHQGQFICTWPDLDVIIAITSRDSTDYTSSCELLDLVASGLDFDADVSSSSSPPPTTRPTQRHTPSTPPSQRSIAHPRSRGRPPTHTTVLTITLSPSRSHPLFSLLQTTHLSLTLALRRHSRTHSRRTPPKSLKTLLCTLSNFGYVYGTLFHQSSVNQSPVRPRLPWSPPLHRRLASFCCCARRRCSSRRSSSR